MTSGELSRFAIRAGSNCWAVAYHAKARMTTRAVALSAWFDDGFGSKQKPSPIIEILDSSPQQ